MEDTNGSVVTAAVLGLLSATAPTAASAALKGQNNATNGRGYGVYGSHAGSGIGVNGYSPRGIGVRGQSTDGTGVYGVHSNGATVGAGVQGVRVSASGSAVYNAGVWGDSAIAAGVVGTSILNYGVRGSSRDSSGLLGTTVSGPAGVSGVSSSTNGVTAISSGSARDNAALRANNFNTSIGMAGYFTNNSDFATSHFANGGAGEVLYLQANGGLFIRAVNNAENDTKFKVDYAGNVNADGGFFTPAADVAERVAAPSSLEPGDVVAVDRARPNHYRLARTPNSPLVAGVISTRPGVTLGSREKDRRPPLAMSGTVPVKVTAENGAIRPGDLLVSSSSAGRAMRAGRNPQVGTVLGKSLGALRRGTGTITMLVMLR